VSAVELTRAIQATSQFGFLTVLPWWPGARTVLDSVRREFGPGIDGQDSLFVVFEPTLLNVERAIQLREGAAGSGEWGIGGCSRPLQINAPLCASGRAVYFWNLTAILCQANAVGCYLHCGEHRSVTFMTRAFEGVDQVLQSLLRS
jgi:hypothetical protein